MTEPTANTPAANKPKGEQPIIRGYTRDGQVPAELTLWVNTPKPGETPSEKAPDFRGNLVVGSETIYVSAWGYAGGVSETKKDENGNPKPYPPYLSLSANIKDDKAPNGYRSESLEGSVKAMVRTTVGGEKIDVDGSRGLKVIGDLKGVTILTQGVTISGQINNRHPNQEAVMELAQTLGFSEAAVNGFKEYAAQDAERKTAATARP